MRNAKVAAASVDNGGEARVREEVLVGAVPDVLGLDGPLLQALCPLRPVRHRLHLVQAASAANNLVRIESTEDGKGTRVARASRAEADHRVVNEAVRFQLHHVVKVTVLLLWMHCKTEDTIDIVEALCLVQREEVESRAGGMVLIKAGLVVYQFSRDLGRAIVEVLGLV